MPEPKPLYLLADELKFEAISVLADKSQPRETRAELAKHFQRRAAFLQHYKHKLIQRWSQTI